MFTFRTLAAVSLVVAVSAGAWAIDKPVKHSQYALDAHVAIHLQNIKQSYAETPPLLKKPGNAGFNATKPRGLGNFEIQRVTGRRNHTR